MWTPSNASGAVPITTDSTSLISMPAESSAILPASKASSLPVSSIRRRNFVIPAPMIATLRNPYAPTDSAAAAPVEVGIPLHERARADSAPRTWFVPAVPLS